MLHLIFFLNLKKLIATFKLEKNITNTVIVGIIENVFENIYINKI